MLGIGYERNRIIEIEKHVYGPVAVCDTPLANGFAIREAVARTLSPEYLRDTRKTNLIGLRAILCIGELFGALGSLERRLKNLDRPSTTGSSSSTTVSIES
ncbi:hypothetical protein E3N88_12066 [Mikania micrantha]|uniref:Uncharacterized protein n=1 Tax=Mikania micrantha TaxID=192012 RepID=A0A5N6P5T6_9ASTR|nr:hypothetical protein E3N88_12066 [Mikania micrantha]